MIPFVDARVFQKYDDKTFWGTIEESSPEKIIVKWDTSGVHGQTYTTFHGKLAPSSLIRVNDCWEVKI